MRGLVSLDSAVCTQHFSPGTEGRKCLRGKHQASPRYTSCISLDFTSERPGCTMQRSPCGRALIMRGDQEKSEFLRVGATLAARSRAIPGRRAECWKKRRLGQGCTLRRLPPNAQMRRPSLRLHEAARTRSGVTVTSPLRPAHRAHTT